MTVETLARRTAIAHATFDTLCRWRGAHGRLLRGGDGFGDAPIVPFSADRVAYLERAVAAVWVLDLDEALLQRVRTFTGDELADGYFDHLRSGTPSARVWVTVCLHESRRRTSGGM